MHQYACAKQVIHVHLCKWKYFVVYAQLHFEWHSLLYVKTRHYFEQLLTTISGKAMLLGVTGKTRSYMYVITYFINNRSKSPSLLKHFQVKYWFSHGLNRPICNSFTSLWIFPVVRYLQSSILLPYSLYYPLNTIHLY